jgi:hypothetical protein
MPWRRRKAAAPAELVAAAESFEAALESVAEARDGLLLGVPRGRAPLLPLAEALAAFEAGLERARAHMAGWRHPEVEAEWLACRSALAEAASGAERLRLRESPRGYEELAPLLDEVLAPLHAFDAAAERLRDLGV